MAGRRLVVEADGGSRGNPGPAAFGAAVRDTDTGEVLVRLAECIGTATNNVAEYRGLVAGLTAAYAIDPDATVEARLDSKLVVEQMSGRWKIKHPDMRPLALAAREAFPASRVTYTWVPREQNALADRLLNEALDTGRSIHRVSGQRSGASREADDDAEGEPRVAHATSATTGWSGDLGPATTFLLLRHGETPYSVEKRFSGVGSDPSLTERGRAQAQAAGRAMARHGVDVVLSSALRRARETADAVGAALGLDVEVDDGWRETDFGLWDGYTFAEIQARWPDELGAWLGSTSVGPPEGESFDAVTRRVRTARDRALARYAGRTVLVATHVTPVKTMVRLALAAPPGALYRMELATAALSTVAWYADGNASLRAFNDTAHLAR
ncbi:MAG: bifunctional RNase H/acid phosphatase [Actinomycetes bacterium]